MWSERLPLCCGEMFWQYRGREEYLRPALLWNVEALFHYDGDANLKSYVVRGRMGEEKAGKTRAIGVKTWFSYTALGRDLCIF